MDLLPAGEVVVVEKIREQFMMDRAIQAEMKLKEAQESLRDRLAMAALTGLISGMRTMNLETAGTAADLCYHIADRMLVARKPK